MDFNLFLQSRYSILAFQSIILEINSKIIIENNIIKLYKKNMANFHELIAEKYYQKTKEFIITSSKRLYEAQLLKAVYEINVSDLSALELYQYHFSLFHILYNLQDEFYKENKYLNVNFMKIFLIDYPEKNQCQFFDENSGYFCKENLKEGERYCDFHKQKVSETAIDIQSIKYFYLCEENFYKLDEKNADAFLNGCWELLFNYKEFKEAINILNLPENCTIEMVKTAYRNLAKKYHPDLNHSSIDNSSSNNSKNSDFFKINNAYQFLMKVLPKFQLNSFTK